MIQLSIPDTVARINGILTNQHHLVHYKLIDVSNHPVSYYELSYQERIQLLHGTNINQLCKSLLMVNHNYIVHPELTPQQHPRYVLVIIQYIARLHNDRLSKLVYNHISSQSSCIRKNREYNWRLASENDNEHITGYINNAVTPFGLLQSVPIIISDTVAQQCSTIYLGAGHVDLKLELDVNEYISKCNVLVGNVTYD